MGDTSELHPIRRPALVRRLVIGINLAIIVILGLFTLWDYFAEWELLLNEKKLALQDESQIILSSVSRFIEEGSQDIQSYLDRVCSMMRATTSPGHEIVLSIGDKTYLALAESRDSQEIFHAIQEGLSKNAVIIIGGKEVVVGQFSQKGITVYVAEQVSNLREIINAQISRRVAYIFAVVVILAVVVNFVLFRFLVHPVGAMVDVINRFAAGERLLRMPKRITRELGPLADTFDTMAETIESNEFEREIRTHKARMIQESLHPDIANIAGVKISHLFMPASEVAGDYYDIFHLNDDSILLCIADVTGHGVAAALEAAMVKGLIEVASRQMHNPAQMLAMINKPFRRMVVSEDFASVLLVIISPDRRTIHYANAGHEPAYALHTGGAVHRLFRTGSLLGLKKEPDWHRETIEADSGDRLVLLTDGLAETSSPDGELFGRQRLLAVLKESMTKPLETLPGHILNELSTFRQSPIQTDDITMLAVELG